MRSLIKDIRPDIIHSTMPYSHILLGLLRTFFGVRSHEVWFQHGPVGGMLDRIASVFWTDCLLVNSEFTKTEHLKSGLHRFHRIQSIPLCVTEGAREWEREERGVTHIGFAGRICSWKGVHVLIEAANILRESRDPNFKKIHFHICGSAMSSSDQIYEESLHLQVEKYGLEGSVTFHGFMPNVVDFYEKMDLLVHPSIIPEPFGLVVGEAMASNLLVLSSARGGVRELIHEGSTAFSFDGTSGDLALKISEICQSDASVLQEIRERAKDLVTTKHSLEAMISKIEDCYQNLS